MEIEDSSFLREHDRVNIIYHEIIRFGPGGCKQSNKEVVLKNKYFVSRGDSKEIGEYIELTDGFDRGYKRNSIIIRKNRIDKLELTLRTLSRESLAA